MSRMQFVQEYCLRKDEQRAKDGDPVLQGQLQVLEPRLRLCGGPLPTLGALHSRQQCLSRIFLIAPERPPRNWQAKETESQTYQKESRPENPIRRHSSAYNGGDHTANSVAPVRGSENDAGWMEVGAEDVVECKVGCEPTPEDEEPAKIYQLVI
jgi:hypothetical protein